MLDANRGIADLLDSQHGAESDHRHPGAESDHRHPGENPNHPQPIQDEHSLVDPVRPPPEEFVAHEPTQG